MSYHNSRTPWLICLKFVLGTDENNRNVDCSVHILIVVGWLKLGKLTLQEKLNCFASLDALRNVSGRGANIFLTKGGGGFLQI